MAESDSLINGSGTVKKNIHYFIGGVIAIVVVIAIFAQDASTQKKKSEKAKEPPKVAQADGNADGIKGALDKQKAAFVPEERVGVPAVAMEGVGTDAQKQAEFSAAEAQAIEDAKRDAQNNGSSILAINAEAANNLGQLGQLRQAVNGEQQPRFDINEADLRAALTPPVPEEVAPATPRTLTKEEKDQEWIEAQARRNKTNPITEDTANSPYTVFEGAVIPAVLMTKINSQLPGQVTAIVSQDVYDGVSGRYLVIPKGSSIYGTYNNSVIQGQSRLTVAFSRLILPNGRSVSLLGMPAADKVGQHGIDGDVNNRYAQRFGFSFLTAVLGLIVDKNNNNNTTIINAGDGMGTGVSTAAGTILTDIARAEKQRSDQIRPIVTIKQGEKFNINVNRDISISPYM